MNIVVIDLETSEKPILHPWMLGSYLCTAGIQVYRDSGAQYYHDFVYDHDERDCTDDHKLSILFDIQEEIDRCDIIVGHNLKFDLNWLKWNNIDFTGKQLWCTMIAEHMLSGQDKEEYNFFSGQQDLSNTCRRHNLPVKTDVVKSYWDAGKKTREIPLRILLPYQMNDVEITAKLFKSQYVQAKAQENLFKLMQVRNYTLHSITELECNGFPMDRLKAEKHLAHFQNELDLTNSKLKTMFGRKDINLDSGPELSACLFGGVLKRERKDPLMYTRNVTIKEPYQMTYKSGKRKGMTVTKYRNRVLRELTCKPLKVKYEIPMSGIGFEPDPKTECKLNGEPTGVFPTNKDVRKNMKCGKGGGTTAQYKREVLDLLEYRSKIAKFASTFVGTKDGTGLFAVADKNYDALLHPNYNQTIAATGRQTSSNPNGQNFPRSKEDEDGFTNPLKSVFVSKRPNGLILVIDLSQLEWRVAAWLSQDPIAMQEIWDDVDCHLDNAINFFGDAKYRQDAKIMTFRLLYGGSAYAFYMDPKMPSFSKGRWGEIVRQYEMKYRVLIEWQKRNIASVPQNNGFLYSPLGRIYKIPQEPHKKYTNTMVYKDTCIKNYPVQGTATGDIVPLAMNIMWDRMNKTPEKFVSTNWMGQVHDSMIFDTTPDEVKLTAFTGIQVFEDLPVIISDMFNVDFNLPLTGEAEWGPDYGNMTHSVKHEGLKWILKAK